MSPVFAPFSPGSARAADVHFGCPNCGGTVERVSGQDYLRCPFCLSVLPGMLVEVSVDRIVPTGITLDSGCPVCAKGLRSGEVEGRRVLFCPDCRGLLMRQGDFGAIVRERAARRTSAAPSEPRPLDPLSAMRRLDCPNCNQPMEVHPYYGPGNVMIDSCAPCGFVWLDHGEITRIEQASGGHSNLRTRQPLPAAEHLFQRDPLNPDHDTRPFSPLRFLADLFL